VAKKIRIRGKIRPLTRSFRPDDRIHWMKAKAIGMYLNKRQTNKWETSHTEAIELLTEAGAFFITEQSTPSNPVFIAAS